MIWVGGRLNSVLMKLGTEQKKKMRFDGNVIASVVLYDQFVCEEKEKRMKARGDFLVQ